MGLRYEQVSLGLKAAQSIMQVPRDRDVDIVPIISQLIRDILAEERAHVSVAQVRSTPRTPTQDALDEEQPEGLRIQG